MSVSRRGRFIPVKRGIDWHLIGLNIGIAVLASLAGLALLALYFASIALGGP